VSGVDSFAKTIDTYVYLLIYNLLFIIFHIVVINYQSYLAILFIDNKFCTFKKKTKNINKKTKKNT
jgi:hypothetical protein